MTGEHLGLPKRMQDVIDVMSGDCPDREIQSSHCVIHDESLRKTVMNMNSSLNTIIKLLNFIRSRGLNLRPFMLLLEDIGA